MGRVAKTLQKVICLLALCGMLGQASAYNFKTPYSHYSAREDLRVVLANFARAQGLSARISDLVTGVISGSFDNIDPNLFLEGLEAAYGVKYYVLNGNLYFYDASEEIRTIFRPSSSSSKNLRQKLRGSQLMSSDLPLEVDRNGLLVLVGPVNYVNGLVSVAKEFDRSEEYQVIMRVFKLKHAKAQDTRFDNLDAVVVVPGIASILQRMTGSGAIDQVGGFSVTAKSPAQTSLRGSGMAALAGGNSSSGSGATAWAAGERAVVPMDAMAMSDVSGDSDFHATFSPQIMADARLNAVVIQDYKFRMPYYQQVITELDVPLRLVELHAAIVDIDVDAEKSLGIDWRGSHVSGNWGGEFGVGNLQWDGKFPATGNGSNSSSNNGGGVFSTIFQTNHTSFMAQVNMLEDANKAKTLGKPSVLTLDNIEAVLENTITRYVPISGKDSSDLFKVESGTVLRVTPHIVEPQTVGEERLISMVISIQSNQESVGNEDYYTTSAGNITVPPIKQTRINTQALVKEGQSLLLGGYYVQYATDGDNGVPGLKDMPIAGGLFGSESHNSYTRERLLLITPRIVSLDDINVPRQVNELNFDRLATQADYNNVPRVKTEESSGCSSNRNAPTQAATTTANNASSATAITTTTSATSTTTVASGSGGAISAAGGASLVPDANN